MKLKQLKTLNGIEVLTQEQFHKETISGGGGCLTGCREGVNWDCANNYANDGIGYAGCVGSGFRHCGSLCSR